MSATSPATTNNAQSQSNLGSGGVKRPRGRAKSTGRFTSREELCDAVWRNYLGTKANIADVARACRVSASTVSNILDSKEGYPVDGV
jgi:hypothetical protein